MRSPCPERALTKGVHRCHKILIAIQDVVSYFFLNIEMGCGGLGISLLLPAKHKEDSMLTINDVDRIVVSSDCEQSWPCGHYAELLLKDGRRCRMFSSFDVWAIVSKLADERINPVAGWHWKPAEVRHHFQIYSKSCPEMGWEVETVEEVLNRIFTNPDESSRPSFATVY